VSEEMLGSQKFPTLIVVNLSAGTAIKMSLRSDGIFNIDGDVIYRYYPDRSQILFLGRNEDQKSYTLNGAVYKLD
jgi:hypothetical protein